MTNYTYPYIIAFLTLLEIVTMITTLCINDAFHNNIMYINTSCAIIIFQAINNLQYYVLLYIYILKKKEILPIVHVGSVYINNTLFIVILTCIVMIENLLNKSNLNQIYTIPLALFSLCRLITTTQYINKKSVHEFITSEINYVINDINSMNDQNII